MKSCSEIRRQFIQFFEQRGHTFVPSSPLLPAEDPTLLFANAGMNQFKDIFLGRNKRDYVRAANTQKCIRAGGKHNDLEDVGHDTYHHTFFEMLGNWSFGDYFKAEAISWAWELLTDVWGLPKDRLYATVFEGDPAEGLEADTEAGSLWKKVTDIDPSHVMTGGRKDNFWEMGETGPCGPCSEIHVDITPDGSGAALVNAGRPEVIEIWNLVFIQYDRDEQGKLTALPAKHVDTGMGLERAGMVLQGKRSNYATDLFVPIIEKLETLTRHRYGSAAAATAGLDDRFDTADMDNIGDMACRVIADHARALTFAIADGVIPSNEGRGYVLRRILRRAARYGRQYLGIGGPFVVELVPVVVELMGDFFGELKDRRQYLEETIRAEEESFGKTLDRGIDLFEKQAEKILKAGRTRLEGEIAFDLYATYGFPVDLTQLMAAERGLEVDIDGYDEAMARHRELSAAGEAFKAAEIPELPATDDKAKYSLEPITAKVSGWVAEGTYVTSGALNTGDEAAVVLDRTNFYAEQGGQVGDAGHLTWQGGPSTGSGQGKFAVRDTQLAGEGVLHVGDVEAGTLRPGQEVRCEVDPSRLDTMRNHTATHLLNWALREVLGGHVNQAGSVVAPDRLRFDFTHTKALEADELAKAERMVNQRILNDECVCANSLPLAEARKITGVRAVFGEKYPDPVRVVSVGTDDPLTEASEQTPVELCGGTHLARTSQVGLFKILSEESVAKGVRRITAVTGRAAVEHVQRLDAILGRSSAALRVPAAEVPERIAAMQEEIKRLKKAPQPAAAASEAVEPDIIFQTDDGKVIVCEVKSGDAAGMRGLCDKLRQKGAEAILVGGATAKKAVLVAMVDESRAKAGELKAGRWVKAVAPIVGGGGGGKDTLAQAGGKLPEKLPEALKSAVRWVKQRLD
ncbi:MAG: alanine--tRNA ligase [Planctomycetota bacterium]|jgi:alanyl-tRNA synthetase